MDRNSNSCNAKALEWSSAPSEELVRSQLENVLQAAEFRASRRCQDFLQFVIEQTVGRHDDNLKERTIGVEAFGRAADYDTNEDGVVRVVASEVRKRLAHYYAGAGKDDLTLIELPVGHYIPRFSWRFASEQEALVEIASPAAPAPNNATYPKRILCWIVLAPTIVVLVVGLAWWHWGIRSSVLDQFWAPALESPNPVLVVAAFVPGYVAEIRGALEPITGKASVRGFTLLPDQFVGGGDLIAAAKLAGMLTQMRHPYSVRIDNTMSFADLRDTPAVLIGYASTKWAEVSRNLRYFVDDNLDVSVITDYGKPTQWSPHNYSKDWHTDEDYAIVARVHDPETHAVLVIATGCTQYGTQAAAELITRNDLLREALRGAPRDWQRKNLQIVVKVKVIGNSPASTKVVASQYW
jgi:hypothetical protein